MFKVSVVQQFFFPLGGKTGVRKAAGRPHQRRHQRGRAAAVLLVFLRRAGQQVRAQALELLFGPGAQFAGRQGRRVAVLATLDAPRPPGLY